MEDNIFNIAAQSNPAAYNDVSIDEVSLGIDPSDLIVEAFSQEEVIGRLREYLTKLDKNPTSQSTNAKGEIKGEAEYIERLIEDLEGKESSDPSTLRKALREAELAYESGREKLVKTAEVPEGIQTRKKTPSLRRMLAETASASQMQAQLLYIVDLFRN